MPSKLDHDFFTPIQEPSDLIARQIEDIHLFLQLGFALNPLGWKSKIRVKGASIASLTEEQAIQHVKGDASTFQHKSGNLALLGLGKWILVERDGIPLTPILEHLLFLTPSWATPNGWTYLVREPMHSNLVEKFPTDLFDKMQRDVSYVLAPYSLSCPFDNHNHLNSHYCFKLGCKCAVLTEQGSHHFRKQKEPVCTCSGTWNRHFCDFSNIKCPKPRYRLWVNRKLSILSFKTFAEIVLGVK